MALLSPDCILLQICISHVCYLYLHYSICMDSLHLVWLCQCEGVFEVVIILWEYWHPLGALHMLRTDRGLEWGCQLPVLLSSAYVGPLAPIVTTVVLLLFYI